MKTNRVVLAIAAMISLSSSGALAISHYDGGCTQLHFADDAKADTASSTLASVSVPNPIVEGAAQNAEPTTEKLQQARFQHHETAGAVDCELDAIED